MNIIWTLHFLFPLTVMLLPLLPNKILINVFWYPIIYLFIWVYFDGCPLNSITPLDEYNIDSETWSKPIIEKIINKKISEFQHTCFICLYCSFFIVISAYKLLLSCKIK